MQSVWVNEKTCPMCSFPLTVSGGVSTAKTSPREAVRSNLYYARGFPPARPLVLDAVKRRLARHEAGAGAGFGTHGARVAHGGPTSRMDYAVLARGTTPGAPDACGRSRDGLVTPGSSAGGGTSGRAVRAASR